MPELKFRVEDIDAKTASEYLTKTTKNRPLRQQTAKRYAIEMAAGRWNPATAEAIKFDVEGSLIDGQHRLEAIVMASEMSDIKFVSLAVIRGVSIQAQDFIDTGLSRLASDVLALHGIANARTAASVARLAIIYEEGGIRAVNAPVSQPSNSRVLEFSTANVELQVSACFCDHPLMRGIVTKRIAGLIHYVTTGIDEEIGEKFMVDLREGASLKENDPVLRLRNAYIANSSKRRQRLPVTTLLVYAARAWNSRLEGKPVHHFKMVKEGHSWPIFNLATG